MSFDELVEMSEKSLKIDLTMIDKECSNIPTLYNKFRKMWNVESKKMRELEKKYNYVFLETKLYYSGKATEEVYRRKGSVPLKIMKSDINDFIYADSDLNQAKDDLESQRRKVEYLQDIIKSQINFRSNLLKTATEWIKFTQGGI